MRRPWCRTLRKPCAVAVSLYVNLSAASTMRDGARTLPNYRSNGRPIIAATFFQIVSCASGTNRTSHSEPRTCG